MLEKILTVLHTFYIKQNTSDMIIFPIKIQDKDYHLYIIDCIKGLLQEMLKQYLTNNEDIINMIDQNKVISQKYNDYIIKLGPQLNKNIKENLINSANKIKTKYNEDFIYKLTTTDELFILSTLDLETLYNEIKTNFMYNIRLYKINKIAVNNIDYELYTI